MTRNTLAVIAGAWLLASAVPMQAQTANEKFVTSIYIAVHDRDPDPFGWMYWKGLLDSNSLTQDQEVNYFLSSAEFTGAGCAASNTAFLNCAYQYSFNRAPDPGGFNYWMGVLNSGYPWAYVVENFIVSGEFQSVRGSRLGYHTAYVAVTGVTPSNGSGGSNTPQQFTVHYTNPYGSSDIGSGRVVFNADPNGLNAIGSCQVAWYASGDIVLIETTSTSSTNYYGRFGSVPSIPLSDAYCSIDTVNSRLTATASGYDVTLSVTFTSQFSAQSTAHQIYAFGENTEGVVSPWTNLGSWTQSSIGLSVQIAVTGRTGTLFYVGDSFTVTVSGPPNQPVAVSQNGGTASPIGYTNAQGTLTLTGVWGAGDVGSFTQTWYIGAVAAIPGLAFQVASLQCGGLTQRYLGSFEISGPSNFITVTVQGVSSAATGVDILVWHESQTMANAGTFQATTSGSGTWRLTLQSSQFTNLGSYAVAARVRGNNGTTLMCPNPAFYAILNENGVPPQAPKTSCSSLAGTWTDTTSGQPLDTWTLTQSASSISGMLVAEADFGCGNSTWSVSGSGPINGNFTVRAENPNPAGSGACSATPLLTETIAFSNSVCDRASGTFSQRLGSGSVSWTSSPAIPQGETSALSNPNSPWDSHGDSTEVRFRGALVTLSDGTQFSGREVRETAASLTDGCFNLVSNNADGIVPVVPGNVNGSWFVQNDNSYGDDLVGYGPAITRYFQTYAIPSGGSCSLQLQQAMQINVDNNSWQTYATNAVSILVQPTQVSVTRAGAMANKNPYPAQ